MQRTEIAWPRPVLGRCAERLGTGIVGAGERTAETVGRLPIRRHRTQPLQGQTRPIVTEHPGARRATVGRRQPPQARRFAGEEARRGFGIAFDEGVHGVVRYGCPETFRNKRSLTAVGRLAISAT